MSSIQDINLNQFQIPEVSLKGFLKSIKKLQNRAVKIGVAEIKVTVSKPWIKTWKHGLATIEVPYVTIDVEGESPVISGWTFVARFEFSEEFGLLIKKVSKNATIPSFYLKDNGNSHLCEHCLSNRKRRKAYLVQHSMLGTWRQVGSSCVKDFTGHVSPEKLARYWAIMEDLEGINEEDWDLGRGSQEEIGEFYLGDYLTRVATITKAEGFISKAKASQDLGIATAVDALNWMHAKTPSAKKHYEHFIIDQEDADLAQEAIQWAKEIADEEAWDNEFKFTLRNIARAGTVPSYHVGQAGYMIEAYKKAMGYIEEKKQRAEKTQTIEYYPAEIKDRVDLSDLKLVFHTTFDTQYGITHLYKFTDEKHVFVWFASSGQGLVEGQVVSMKATIKKFEEFQDTKQTIITKAKINKEIVNE